MLLLYRTFLAAASHLPGRRHKIKKVPEKRCAGAAAMAAGLAIRGEGKGGAPAAGWWWGNWELGTGNLRPEITLISDRGRGEQRGRRATTPAGDVMQRRITLGTGVPGVLCLVGDASAQNMLGTWAPAASIYTRVPLRLPKGEIFLEQHATRYLNGFRFQFPVWYTRASGSVFQVNNYNTQHATRNQKATTIDTS